MPAKAALPPSMGNISEALLVSVGNSDGRVLEGDWWIGWVGSGIWMSCVVGDTAVVAVVAGRGNSESRRASGSRRSVCRWTSQRIVAPGSEGATATA